MPDPLEINDLSHLSNEEFMALCPIGEHAPGSEPLSPAAQAILDAYGDFEPANVDAMAAALRALADHKQKPICVDQPIDHWTPSVWTRQELRNIAAELESATPAT